MTALKVFGMGYMVPQMLQIYDGGYGRHRKYLNPAQINIVGSSNVAINVLTSNSLCWSRASIIVFLLRIIGSIQRWARLLCFSMGLNLAVMIGTCRFKLSIQYIPRTECADTIL